MNLRNFSIAIAAGTGMACVPMSAFSAEDLSYNYLELGYVIQDIDLYEDEDVLDDFLDDMDDGDGFQGKASFQVMDRLLLFASYSDVDVDFAFVDNNNIVYTAEEPIKTLEAGLGYIGSINTRTDFVTRVAYKDVDVGDFNLGAAEDDVLDDDVTIGDALDDLDEDSSDGYFIDVGVRSQIVEWLEIGGGVRYTDLDAGDDFSAFGNALFEFNDNVGINVIVDLGDELSTYEAALRYAW